MAVDTFAEAEALVDDVGPRAPGSDGERAAAEHLAVRLRALGRSVEIEPFAVWPRWPLAHALHTLAAITASLLSLVTPGIAVALAGLVTLLTVLDAAALLTTTRRLLGRRESANVVSWGDRTRPRALLLVAHCDSGPGGLATYDRLRRRLASLPVSPWAGLCWLMAGVLVVCLLRVADISGFGLDLAQFLVTVALIVALPLLLGLALSPTGGGERQRLRRRPRPAARRPGTYRALRLTRAARGIPECVRPGHAGLPAAPRRGPRPRAHFRPERRHRRRWRASPLAP
jgi:hypothetical protein